MACGRQVCRNRDYLEETEAYLATVGEFLAKVDAGKNSTASIRDMSAENARPVSHAALG